MGAVTDVVKRYVPASYRALVGATNSYDYNISNLQALADFVQFRLFATVPGADNEATLWNYNERELLGIVTTMQFIPGAVDFWGDHLASQSTAPTQEDVAWFDHRPDLWRTYDRLAAQAAILAPVVGVNLKSVRNMLPLVSYGDNGRNILRTPDPLDFDPEFGTPNSSVVNIAWSND